MREATVAELKDRAKALGIKGYASMNKAALLEEIENAEGADGAQSADAEQSDNARTGDADFASVKSAEASETAAPDASLDSKGVDEMLSQVESTQVSKKEKKAKGEKVRAKDMKFKN